MKIQEKMSTAKPDDKSSDIPERLYDATTRRTYKRLRFFGKVSAAWFAMVELVACSNFSESTLDR